MNDALWTELAQLNQQYMQQQQLAAQKTQQLNETHSALIEEESSIKAALAIRRQHGAHLERMAAFWQDQEVSIPNKPVPVPRSMLFRGKKHQTTITVTKIDIVKVESYNKLDEASTSAGSGSQRSHEEHTEPMMKHTNSLNPTTTTTTNVNQSVGTKIVEEGDYPDCGCDCGELLRAKSA